MHDILRTENMPDLQDGAVPQVVSPKVQSIRAVMERDLTEKDMQVYCPSHNTAVFASWLPCKWI